MAFALSRFFAPMRAMQPLRVQPRSFTTASRPLFNAKTTTNLTGLPVVPNAREVLISLYNKTIRTAKAFDDVPYNDHIINLCRHRLDIVQANQDIATIEEKINYGQVEELISQAEDELELLMVMNEDFRLWEPDPEGKAEYEEWKDDFFSADQEEPDAADFEAEGLGEYNTMGKTPEELSQVESK